MSGLDQNPDPPDGAASSPVLADAVGKNYFGDAQEQL
jgi:hypothetical protein